MVDLISREAAIKEVKRMLIDCCGDFNGTLIGNDIKVMLNKLHTVDAVPVVRCKDCIYFDDEVSEYCDWFNSVVDETGYCAYGERKEKALERGVNNG